VSTLVPSENQCLAASRTSTPPSTVTALPRVESLALWNTFESHS
jgi:hypothetical protein